MLKKIKHYIEATALYLLFTAFRQFSLDTSSAMGGWMARAIGPSLSAHKTARKNLERVFSDMPEKDKEKILSKMWDNLGRTSAELVHLPHKHIAKRIKIIGAENLPLPEKPAFLFSGHVGNWELLACVAELNKRPITAVYREANNKIVDNIIAKIRAVRCVNLIPKGRQGAVKLARAIKNNEAIAMLVDQKMNDGISIPFFGYEAMTAPAIAELALRYDVPIVPARIVRTKGAHFEGIVYPALTYERTGDKSQDVKNIMIAINKILENWIKEYPEQWFWVHKRWPKD